MEENIKQNIEKQEAERRKQEERIIRILQTDIDGKKQIYAALTKIKGVSWSLSNAVCKKLNLERRKKIGSLSQEEIKKVEEFIRNPHVPEFLFNRRKDLESGRNMHLIGSDLDLRKEFDIKRLKKIKSYRGLRHALGQPTRGQRTRSHFRAKGKSVGVTKKSKIGKKS